MPSHEHLPRLAIVLPHPEQPETCAIDGRTGTLPGVQVDITGKSLEKLALDLAASVNAHRRHGVDRAITVEPTLQLSLYILKRPAHADLARPYQWAAYDMDTLHQAYKRILDPATPPMTQAHREIVERPAMQALSITTILSSVGTVRAEDTIRSFFFEESGMYDLPLASSIERA